ncbi:hypothetical protein BGX31_009573 [Mortierella sp. GBA43]|nr:hypothetical protein BGX31_009573 [Mortierella sp. GBA43]
MAVTHMAIKLIECASESLPPLLSVSNPRLTFSDEAFKPGSHWAWSIKEAITSARLCLGQENVIGVVIPTIPGSEVLPGRVVIVISWRVLGACAGVLAVVYLWRMMGCTEDMEGFIRQLVKSAESLLQLQGCQTTTPDQKNRACKDLEMNCRKAKNTLTHGRPNETSEEIMTDFQDFERDLDQKYGERIRQLEEKLARQEEDEKKRAQQQEEDEKKRVQQQENMKKMQERMERMEVQHKEDMENLRAQHREDLSQARQEVIQGMTLFFNQMRAQGMHIEGGPAQHQPLGIEAAPSDTPAV